ncbi:MAG: hypothetical protein KC583_21945, partial [Myxococcales bacterium]|nr:hypothetical protein [Myxococcales bacterium]
MPIFDIGSSWNHFGKGSAVGATQPVTVPIFDYSAWLAQAQKDNPPLKPDNPPPGPSGQQTVGPPGVVALVDDKLDRADDKPPESDPNSLSNFDWNAFWYKLGNGVPDADKVTAGDPGTMDLTGR